MDLGTANTVLAVVDSTNRPIAGVSAPSHAIRDGVIVEAGSYKRFQAV